MLVDESFPSPSPAVEEVTSPIVAELPAAPRLLPSLLGADPVHEGEQQLHPRLRDLSATPIYHFPCIEPRRSTKHVLRLQFLSRRR